MKRDCTPYTLSVIYKVDGACYYEVRFVSGINFHDAHFLADSISARKDGILLSWFVYDSFTRKIIHAFKSV